METGYGRKLRIGILIDGFIQPRWVDRIIQDIKRSSFGEIVLVIQNGAKPKGPANFIQKIVARRNHLLWAAYARLFRPTESALEEIDITQLLAEYPRLLVTPVQNGHIDYFDVTGVNEIISCDLDVALRFGFRIIKGRGNDDCPTWNLVLSPR